jgi:alkyl hydroperoxide reductase subunit AhpF
MALLNDNIKKQVSQMLGELEGRVKIVLFTQLEGLALECETCAETRQLLEEVTELSDRLALEVHDFVADKALADSYGIDKIPGFAILSDEPQVPDDGIRMYGIPAGYEFGTLIETLRLVSSRQHGLNPNTLMELQRLDKPVQIQVYVTPT